MRFQMELHSLIKRLSLMKSKLLLIGADLQALKNLERYLISHKFKDKEMNGFPAFAGMSINKKVNSNRYPSTKNIIFFCWTFGVTFFRQLLIKYSFQLFYITIFALLF